MSSVCLSVCVCDTVDVAVVANRLAMLQKKHLKLKVRYFLLACLITYGITQFYTISTHCSLDDVRNTPTDQHSPCLTKVVRKVIVPPSELPYNLVDGTREHSHGQAQLIKKLFRGMVGRKY